jgi:hypothetical protein
VEADPAFNRAQRGVAGFATPHLTAGERIEVIVPDVLSGISWFVFFVATAAPALVIGLVAGAVLRSVLLAGAFGGIVAGIMALVLLMTVAHTYALALTDQRLLFIRRSFWTGRPQSIDSHFPRQDVRLTDLRGGTLFGTFKLGLPGSAPVPLSFRRATRSAVLQLAAVLGSNPV